MPLGSIGTYYDLDHTGNNHGNTNGDQCCKRLKKTGSCLHPIPTKTVNDCYYGYNVMARYSVKIGHHKVDFNHKADEGDYVVVSPSYGKMGSYSSLERAVSEAKNGIKFKSKFPYYLHHDHTVLDGLVFMKAGGVFVVCLPE